jgi:hypothetical protein
VGGVNTMTARGVDGALNYYSANLRGVDTNPASDMRLYAHYISDPSYFGGYTILFNIQSILFTSVGYGSSNNANSNKNGIWLANSDATTYNVGLRKYLSGVGGNLTTKYTAGGSPGINVMVANSCDETNISLMQPLASFEIDNEVPVELL